MLRPFIIDRRAPLRALLVSTVVAACAGGDADQQSRADSALARDLALVQSATTAQPIFRDTALTATPAPRAAETPEAPRRARPLPRPARRTRAPEQTRAVPRPEPRRPTRVAEVQPPELEIPAPLPAQSIDRSGEAARGRIGAGTVLTATSNARICTRSNLPGDRISATVSAPVRGSNGAEIPAGSKVILEVASISATESGEGHVSFRVHALDIGDESYPTSGSAAANGQLERVQGPRSASSDRKKVIGGAIAGAILGQTMGKDTRSTVIGAAAGAAAGTAAAKMGGSGETCLAAGAPLRVTLEEAVLLQ